MTAASASKDTLRDVSIDRILDDLAAQLDGTVLRDGPICARMRARMIEDYGEDGELGACVVLFRTAASERTLERLDALCRERFARPLPPELHALWRRTDGLAASVLGADEDPADPALTMTITGETEMLVAPEGVLGADAVWRAASEEIAQVTHPDGRVERRALLALPFVEVPDQGWYALDLHRARADGSGAPVIAYWHDEVSALAEDPAAEMAAREVIAPDLEAWLRMWIASGFDPFPHVPRGG